VRHGGNVYLQRDQPGASGFDLVPQPVFWTVLAVTVLVLLGLVVRLMKREVL